MVGIKVVYKDVGLQQIFRKLEEAASSQLRVGLVGPHAEETTSDGRLTLKEAGLILEYGTRKVPIPARSFIRKALTAARTNPIISEVGRQIWGYATVDLGLEVAGTKMVQLIQSRLMEIFAGGGDVAPNAPATIRKKGFNAPLFETNRLFNAISYQIRRAAGGFVEAGAAVGDFESFEIEGGGEE